MDYPRVRDEGTRFDKGIYWHDTVDTKEDEQADFEIQVKDPCEENKIYFKSMKYTDVPPFKEDFDVLFFDWGGMSLGNSMMDHFCRYILEHAEDHPNRFYVMVSSFTKEAMADAVETLGKDKPFNVMLSVDELGAWLIRNENI